MPRRARPRSRVPVAGSAAPPPAREAPDSGLQRLHRRTVRVVRRRPAAIALGLVALHVALALATFEPRPHTGGDNAAYITLARSLLEHGTYSELWDPAAPPHTKYPPVFPAVLAVALALGLAPWVQLKFVVLSFSAAAVALSFLWLRSRRRSMMAIGAGLLLAVAPGVLREGRWILSDVPFWAFTMAALWSFDRLRPGDWKRFAPGAAAVLLAYFTRSAGLPLVLAALGWLAWRRLWPQFGALAALVGIPALLWWLRSRLYSGSAAYVAEFWLIDPYLPALGTVGAVDLLLRVLENAQNYATTHLPVLLMGGTGLWPGILGAALCALALFGWVLRLRQPRTAELFLPLYIGLIFLWPAVWSGERFLLPVLPALLYYAAEGVVRVAGRLRPRYTAHAAVAAAALLLALALPGLAAAARVGFECTARYRAGERYPCLGGEAWEDFFAVAELSGRVLPEGAVVMNRKPRLLHVLSGGVKSVNYPLSADPAAFFATADSTGARYVIFDRLDAVSEYYLRPVLMTRPGAFCLMRIFPATSTALFGLVPGGAAAPAASEPADDTVSFRLCDTPYWTSPEAQQLYEG
jgi:hypothetical protein